MIIHFRDFLDMKNAKISVEIKKDMKDKIKTKIEDRISYFAKELKIVPARLYEYFVWQKSVIPLGILLTISKKLGIKEKEIEDSVIYYKQLHVPYKNSIKNPKLPIKLSPYFTSLIANLFFDGSVPEDGKGTYYNQKNEEIMQDFIKKINSIFGDVFYSSKRDHRGVLKCRIPRLVGEICRYIYDVKHFGTFQSRIPEKIFNLPLIHKQAFVLTGIIDEGSIAYDGSVIFGVSNKEMVKDFNKLCLNIGLRTSGVKNKKNSNHFYIYIISSNKLLAIINSLKKSYPLISLRHKEDRLKKSIEIKSKSQNCKEFSKDILEELKNKKCSVNFLASKYLINPRTVRYNLYKLIKKSIIKREKIGNEYIYLINQINFSNASLNSK